MARTASRKHRSHSSRSSPRSPFAGGEPIALFDGMCRKTLTTQGREVVASADPLEAEMWVSWLLGMWSDLPMINEPDPAGAIGGRLVSVAQKRRTPEAQVCLRALAAVAGGALGRQAEKALASLGTAGAQVPSWTRMIGAAQPTAAWRASDLWGDQDAIMVGFRYPDGAEHCVMVLVDHLLGGIAKDATALMNTSMDAALRGWDGGEFDLVEEGIGKAASRIMNAAAVTERIGGQSTTEDYTGTVALLSARFGHLAADAPVLASMPEAEREELVVQFLAARPGRPFARDPDAQLLLNVLIDWRCDAGGDPLRWSDSAVAMFLLDYVPRCLVVRDVQRAPDVLRAWIPWAAARAGLRAFHAQEAVAMVEELRDEALKAASDETRWHPTKRVAMRMLAEGVDVSDADAVEEWLLSDAL